MSLRHYITSSLYFGTRTRLLQFGILRKSYFIKKIYIKVSQRNQKILEKPEMFAKNVFILKGRLVTYIIVKLYVLLFLINGQPKQAVVNYSETFFSTYRNITIPKA